MHIPIQPRRPMMGHHTPAYIPQMDRSQGVLWTIDATRESSLEPLIAIIN